MTHYATLGVSENAGQDEIKRAYDHHSWERNNVKHDPTLEPITEQVKPVKKFKR